MQIDPNPMVRWSGVERRPFVIAGPCSAESREQVMETARRLSGAQVHYLRAGIWKPRTRPNNFEGIGEPALAWLRDAGKEHGLKTATEVALPSHVEAALNHGIDLLWLGARTTVNPFSVQEIANALRGVKVPVLVKNPTSPDMGLWMGALERVHGAGVRDLGAIHRGFHTAGDSLYRNPPMWDMVIELRRSAPALPIFTDPSHIAGRRELIHPVSQRAMDLGLDGLVVETHPNPDQAWSDASQQVTPERFLEILDLLRVRQAATDDAVFNQSLEELREQIDQVDHDILDVLAHRMRIVEQIAEAKQASNVTTLQVNRWKALLEDRIARAAGLGLDGTYIKAIYEEIHRESVRRQSELMSNDEERTSS
jgi:chorismate mutase